MDEWSELSLGQTGAIVTGKTPSKDNPEDWGNEMPFVTPSDYGAYGKKAYAASRMLSAIGANRLRGKIIESNSIMVTCIGSDMGKVAMNALPVITNQQINSIIPNKNVVDPDFLYYQLVSMYDTLRAFGGDGTAVPIVNKGDFSNIKAEFPQPIEQKAIAEVLSSLDDKIDLLHRQNKTLEALAETLFRHWFIDGAQDDWESETLGSFISISSGKGFKRSDFDEAGAYKVLGANGEIGRCNAFNFDERLLFTGRVGTLGNIFIVNERVWLSDNTLVIRVPLPQNFYFVYFTLKLADLQSLNVGSTQPLIRQSEVKELEILAPKDALLEQFHTICEVLFGKVEQNKRQIGKQEEIRDTLLPKLMSGDVRVDYEAAA